MYFSCSWRTMKMVSVVHTSARHKAELHLIDVHHLANVEVEYPFQQLHDLICEFETMIIATVKGFTFPLLTFITKLFLQSYGITLQLKTASASCLVSSTPSSPAAFSISATMPDGPAALLHFIFLSALWIWLMGILGGGQQLGDLKELIAWPMATQINIEQPSIVLNPCIHLVFVSERKLTSIIAYTVLTSDVLVSEVHLFGYTENTITIWGYRGEFLILRPRLCQLDMFCHTLGIMLAVFAL